MGKIIECRTCGKKFSRWNKKQQYCSITCFWEYPRKLERIHNAKKCIYCKRTKPLPEFYERKETKTHKGYRSTCKKCEIQQAKLYAEKNKDKIKKREHKRMTTPKGQFNKYRVSAKRFGKEFKLTIKFFEDNQGKVCFYCGQYKTDALSMGIDRIDSKIGYIPKNCVPCCKKCNLAKFTYSPQEFIEHINKIANYQRSKK